ncbi:MAG: hypothetical protein QWI73_07075 [Alphaproteobacteria bacterium]|nr:hypothetical protein [Alphaproteobacteria bacterium]MDN5249828.1 hypothetical protein [Alphaproteobacteria bacterium]
MLFLLLLSAQLQLIASGDTFTAAANEDEVEEREKKEAEESK